MQSAGKRGRLVVIKSTLFISLHLAATLLNSEQASCQTFIHDCNDINIMNHFPDFDHTYCAHTCRPNPEQTAVCSNSGNCLCHLPCYNDPDDPMMAEPISNDICPPFGTDAPDPDLPALTDACEAACPVECPEGTGGTICGETQPFFDPNMMRFTIFTTICTCVCPAQRCPPITVPTTTTTTTTTTTPPPADTTVSTSPNSNSSTLQTQGLAFPNFLVVFPSKSTFKLKLLIVFEKFCNWIWDLYKGHFHEVALHFCLEVMLNLLRSDFDLNLDFDSQPYDDFNRQELLELFESVYLEVIDFLQNFEHILTEYFDAEDLFEVLFKEYISIQGMGMNNLFGFIEVINSKN